MSLLLAMILCGDITYQIASFNVLSQVKMKVLVKSICEMLIAPLIPCPHATVPGMESIINMNPALVQGLWCGVWKGKGKECRTRDEAL